MKKTAILIRHQFAAELSAKLTIPHTLEKINGQTDSEIANLVSQADVLVSGEFKSTWVANHGTFPLLVQTVGAGIDGIDLPSLPAGCTVCNVHGHERGVAEHAFLLMLALQRQLKQLDRALRKGDWTPQPAYLNELRHRHLLILGLGHIGLELVRWGQFMEMKVTALTRTHSRERTEKLALHASGGLNELEQYLGWADFIVVAIPSATGTIDLINASQFQRMKPSAFLINVGRARVVNETALFEALNTRQIAGAGLDVWYDYPDREDQLKLPSRLPFDQLDNIIMTPHKPTRETMEYRWGKIAENISRFACGDPLHNVVYATV